MKGLNPGPEGMLGASERAVRLDTELGSAASAAIRHRLAVGWPGNVIGVALGTTNAVGPSLGDQPGFS